jgi:hypothetical protein
MRMDPVLIATRLAGLSDGSRNLEMVQQIPLAVLIQMGMGVGGAWINMAGQFSPFR